MAGTLTNPRKSKRTIGTSTLKSMINDERTKNKFKELLGNKAAGFLTSLLNTTNGNKQLQEAEPQSILKAGAIAATLDLPIDPNLGFAYIVPYKNKYKDETGNWREKNEAQFQLGYKGFIQLAIRTGQYKKINVTELYEVQPLLCRTDIRRPTILADDRLYQQSRIPPARRLRILYHSVQLHGYCRQPQYQPCAYGQCNSMETRYHGSAIELLRYEDTSRSWRTRRRHQLPAGQGQRYK